MKSLITFELKLIDKTPKLIQKIIDASHLYIIIKVQQSEYVSNLLI